MSTNQVNLVSSVYNLITTVNLSDTRIYNFLMHKLNNHKKVVDLMVNELGYEKWYVNKIAYNQKYSKQRYLKFNSANNI